MATLRPIEAKELTRAGQVLLQNQDSINRDLETVEKKTSNTSVLHVYANSSTGSDSSDGLSPARPKKSLKGVRDALPDVLRKNVVIHLSGTFDLAESFRFFPVGSGEATTNFGPTFTITGDATYTVVDDNGGSNYTATGSSATSLTVAGAGWTVNEHSGYLLQIMTGAQAGKIVGAIRNTATVVDMTTAGADPGLCEFRFVRPSTEITSSVSYQSFGLQGANVLCHFQDLYISNELQLFVADSVCHVSAARVVVNTSGTQSAISFQRSCFVGVPYVADVTTGYKTFTVGTPTLCEAAGQDTNFAFPASNSLVSGIFKGNLEISQGAFYIQWCWVQGETTLRSCGYNNSFSTSLIDNTTSNGPIPSFDGGLVLDNCHGKVEAVAINKTAAGPALEICNGSHIVLDGVLTGTAASGFGCYAHSNSFVTLTGTPTLTGSGGNLTIDGTTLASTWAAVAGGTPVVNVATDFVMVK